MYHPDVYHLHIPFERLTGDPKAIASLPNCLDAGVDLRRLQQQNTAN